MYKNSLKSGNHYKKNLTNRFWRQKWSCPMEKDLVANCIFSMTTWKNFRSISSTRGKFWTKWQCSNMGLRVSQPIALLCGFISLNPKIFLTSNIVCGGPWGGGVALSIRILKILKKKLIGKYVSKWGNFGKKSVIFVQFCV